MPYRRNGCQGKPDWNRDFLAGLRIILKDYCEECSGKLKECGEGRDTSLNDWYKFCSSELKLQDITEGKLYRLIYMLFRKLVCYLPVEK